MLTRCFVTPGAEFRVKPVLKFCSMSEVHAGLICSTTGYARRGWQASAGGWMGGWTWRRMGGSQIY